MELSADLKSRQEVRDLVAAARAAQKELARFSQEQIDRITEAMAREAHRHALRLGQMAVEETGFGNAQDKASKNKFASLTLWHAIKEQKTVGILKKDEEKQVWDIAVPVGVIAGIAPSTNPTSTVIYKSIIAIKAGNAIVLSPHPGAKKCSLEAARIVAKAAEEAGCPKGAIGCITMPTMAAVDELMKHPDVDLILATGGSAMVRAAYSSGTPAIGVGAGNGPAYLHPDCDFKQAARDIVRSKTFDNGTVCASEQSVILLRSHREQGEQALEEAGCCILSEEDGKKLSAFLFRGNGTMNPAIVGKTAAHLAEMAGLSPKAKQARVLIARETGAGKNHPYSMEKLCPVLGLYVVDTEEEALELTCSILEHEGSGHTFTIHARDARVVEKFALRVPVSRFLVNVPAALGGIGASSGLFPALTLGCGAVGGSSSSNNIGPMDLINIRRAAWGHKSGETAHTETENDDLVEQLTQRLLDRLLKL